MVPHGTIESKLIELYGHQQDQTCLVIMGIKDEAKGEAIVLLTNLDLDMQTLRADMSRIGLPNLWIPKAIHKVESIPLLASGKLDLKACQQIADQLA